MSQESDYQGFVDLAVFPYVEGWVWDKNNPDTALEVEIYFGKKLVATANARAYRDDLEEAKIGDGYKAFYAKIDEELRPDEAVNVYVIVKTTTYYLANSGVELTIPGAENSYFADGSDSSYEGILEVAEYPEVRGWVWDKNNPDTTLEVELSINQNIFSKAHANIPRQDLLNKNKGDGRKAFSTNIPLALTAVDKYEIRARVKGTNYELENSPIQLNFSDEDTDFKTYIERNKQMSPEEDSPSESELAALYTKKIYPDAALSTHRIDSLENLVPPTIIIPIYNAAEELDVCLQSIACNTTYPVKLLLINDASTDERIAQILSHDSELSANVSVINNEENLGFTKTINIGLRHTKHDVIILNSDTQVTPRWVENLIYSAYKSSDIATVTAISDNIGVFSVPRAGDNVMPENISRDHMGRYISATSQSIYPNVPTGNGFCMYIKRSAIDKVGFFDEESFPRGYGEENDFCVRCVNEGLTHIVDDTVFVLHKRSSSFKDEKRQLLKNASAKLKKKHPEYNLYVNQVMYSRGMREVRKNVYNALTLHEKSKMNIGKPRLLFVMHGDAKGGTPQTNIDLMQSLANEYETFCMECDLKTISISYFEDEKLHRMESWDLPTPISPFDKHRSDYIAVMFEMLKNYAIEMVHIRHLYKHTMDLPRVAKVLNIPVILSFHDFYYVCPTINLIDSDGKYCAGNCNNSGASDSLSDNEDCTLPTEYQDLLPELRHKWIHTWRQRVSEMFTFVDRFITTCEDAKNLYQEIYPELHNNIFSVIEHGRIFDNQLNLAAEIVAGEKLRILVPGHLTRHKGGDFIAALVALDRDNKHLDFHFLGNLPEQYKYLGTWHGLYKREDFSKHVADINCHITAIFSIWPETYCHTLSESWACGVPVVVSSLGAPKNRVEKHGGGWVIDTDNPEETYKKLLDIAENPQRHSKEAAKAGINNLRTIAEMSEDYQGIYRQVFDSQKAFRLNAEE